MSETHMEPCNCEDFEPVDTDDTLCHECACGHIDEEHGKGMFRRCRFNTSEE